MSLPLPLGIGIGGLPLTMLLPLRTSLPDVRPGTVPTSPIPASTVPPRLTCVRDFPYQPQYPRLISGDNYNRDVCERTQIVSWLGADTINDVTAVTQRNTVGLGGNKPEINSLAQTCHS